MFHACVLCRLSGMSYQDAGVIKVLSDFLVIVHAKYTGDSWAKIAFDI